MSSVSNMLGEPQTEYRDYEPIHPEPSWRSLLRKLWAPIAVAFGLFIKFGFAVFKFFGIFISVGGYALIWGWKFAIGFVALILVHELGHFFEGRRQGLEVSLPTFIPFLGAFVLIKNAPLNPWRNALVALAGPAAGGLGSAFCYGLGEAMDSRLLLALGYAGFLLNLFNLIPVGILDGGAIVRAIRIARATPGQLAGAELALPYGTIPGGGPSRALQIGFLYVSLIVLLLLGMWIAHVPQSRL
jgi:Zn-dependent protease